MNRHKKQWVEIMYGAALIAACSGKLAVDDGPNRLSGNGGSSGAGGARGGGPDASAATGGAPVETGGIGAGRGGNGGAEIDGSISYGGAGGSERYGGTGGKLSTMGGAAGCFSGPEPATGGGYSTGGRGFGTNITPTCPLDSEGFATVDLSVMCASYSCPASSSDLVKGLDCTEVTTDRTGFTKTVGCGFETIEFQSYEYRGAFDLEHEYAASYNLATGELVGLIIKEPYQFDPCMSYAYRAGAVPADCASAVTYKCKRIPQGGSADDAYLGCRAPDEPGCAECCESSSPDYCTVNEASYGATIYNSGTGQGHACRCDCKPCAHCKLEDERSFRAVYGYHPECNCSLPPTGDFCSNWCASRSNWESLCPGLL